MFTRNTLPILVCQEEVLRNLLNYSALQHTNWPNSCNEEVGDIIFGLKKLFGSSYGVEAKLFIHNQLAVIRSKILTRFQFKRATIYF